MVGTGSSILAGPDGPSRPIRRGWKRPRPPAAGVAVKVVTLVRTRQTAEDMARDMSKMLADEKPDLVIWQTGTVDAMRGIDPDDFRIALDAGVDELQKAGPTSS